jgi:putative heme-binding domain-containing protein
VLVPHGSTFRTVDEDFVASDDPDFHPSDVLEDADGSLLVLDTGSWYTHHCPTGRIRNSSAAGGIYRVRYGAANRPADPWGLKEHWANASPTQLARLLGDLRPAVRDRAQQELIARAAAAVPALASLLRNTTNEFARSHALWALGGIPDPSALEPLRSALASPDAQSTATAARILALRADKLARPQLENLLARPSQTEEKHLHLRRAAAEALAHCGNNESLPVLWSALAEQPDRFLEHALIHAAHHLADAHMLTGALQHPHARVRKAALLLLDQPPRAPTALAPEQVLDHLSASDAPLRETALRILQKRPAWAAHALALVQSWLAQPALAPEQTTALADLIVAFRANTNLQALVAEALRAPGRERREALLDAVARTRLPVLPQSWAAALERLLADPDADVRLRTAKTVNSLRAVALEGALNRLANDAQQPPALRLEAWRGTIAKRPKLAPEPFEFLASQLHAERDPLVRLSAADMLHRAQLTDRQLLQVLQAVRGQSLMTPGPFLTALRDSASDADASALVDYLAEIIPGSWSPRAEEFEQFLQRLPAQARERAKSIQARLRAESAAPLAKLSRYEPLLGGGDATAGQAVFSSPKAACSVCHAVGADGGRIGPDLTRIGAVRSGRDLLESILFPSSTFAQGYESYALLTIDDRELYGTLARSAADVVVLRDSTGQESHFRQQEVRELRRQTVSLMPEGLESGLSEAEFRDLLAFLLSLK